MSFNCNPNSCKFKPYLLHALCRKKFIFILILCGIIVVSVNFWRSGMITRPSSPFDTLHRHITEVDVRSKQQYANLTNRMNEMIMIMKNKKLTKDKISVESNERKESLKQGAFGTTWGVKIPQKQQTESCSFSRHPLFPLCNGKLNFLRRTWNKDKCLRDDSEAFTTVKVISKYNFTNARCGIYHYLTRIEPFCLGAKDVYPIPNPSFALPSYEMDGLLKLMPGKFYKWMRRRATFLWDKWVEATKRSSLISRKNRKKNVVVFLAGLNFNKYLIDMADKGGPLGELVQWTDLITALYVLGYEPLIVKTVEELEPFIKSGSNTKIGCASGIYQGMFDIIYSDINGFVSFSNHFGFGSGAKFRCAFRVLDSFGTFVEYNFPGYPRKKIPGGGAGWSMLNLIPTQFLTLYPHTQDNSYLGFVVPDKAQRPTTREATGKQKALLYAKDSSYITYRKSSRKYLDIISEYFEIQSTCANAHHLPSYVHNHGSVTGERVQELLSESKLFIGVGFPYEGPGPIEAMANGAVYIQPKFDTPVNKLNEKFFGGKPTLRKLGSQNPYMEEFIGEPYCYTVNVTNEELLRKTLENIRDMKRLPGKIPKDFSYTGMLERVHIYTQRINYCNPYVPRWPPVEGHLKIELGLVGQSCKETCMSKGLVCERTFFSEVNSKSVIEDFSSVSCLTMRYEMELHAPSVDEVNAVCYIQVHGQAFSCMHIAGVRRICPCRDYEQGQSAVCNNCL